MVTIQLASDIHTEFHKGDQGRKLLQRIAKHSSSEVDAILVPGDLSTTRGLKYAFSILCDKFENVIYTAGNHEYYNSSKAIFEELMAELCHKHSNLHWLNNSVVEIKEQRFIGCTLWFPPVPFVLNNLGYTNDCRLIKPDRNKFDRLPHWILEEFYKSKGYLYRNVQEGDVVLTHYIPCPEGIHPKWRAVGGNEFFMGDVTNVILDNKPKLWVFGHTHSAMDFKLGDTHLACNPCGYPHEPEYQTFNDSLIIDV